MQPVIVSRPRASVASRVSLERGLAVLMLALLAGQANAAAGDAADAVLLRTIGPRAAELDLQLQPAGKGNDWYRIDAGAGKVRISGSSEIALSHGAYTYLNQAGALSASWEGTRVALPAQWPVTASGVVRTPFQHRAYLNTCTYGYTTPFWDWARWEREIDWMALHGIDLPLAMEGQEAVWQQLWRGLGVSDAGLSDYFSGPAFTPWQRMGNIEGYQAPLPQAWIDKKQALQKQILARMHALGMKPVLPAFAGYVPKAFAQQHPEARIYKMRAWEGFHETYWLDPADPLFARIAKQFIDLYTQTYGPGEYYLADAFNEMLPPVAADGSDAQLAKYGDSTANTAATKPASAVTPEQKRTRLADYGAAIYDSIRQANPKATWVMQGWLFGADKEFWSPDAIAAFLGKVPNDKLMVLDIGNDRYPGTWKKSGAFDGKPWIYGYVHNYGGSNPVYADFNFYQQDLSALLAEPDHGQLRGFGVFPEGLDSNSVAYEYLYSLAWEGPKQDFAGWFGSYAKARYGHTSPQLEQAWTSLQAGVFGVRYWDTRWWKSRAGAYLLFKRPTPDITSFDKHPGDMAQLRAGIEQLLAVAPQYADAPLFRHDLVDFTRHYALERLDQVLQQAVQAYQGGDATKGDALAGQVTALAQSIDTLLAAQPESLARWQQQAAAYGDDAETSAYYVRNARAQVTVWGGEGNLSDYASKAWSGMVAGYYLPRWQQLFAALRATSAQGVAFDEPVFHAQVKQWELAWVARTDAPAVPVPPADVVASAKALMQQLDAQS
jgi:alpha-N-acetylglucosaminidase